MNDKTTQDKIAITQTQLNLEDDFIVKQELQKKLKKLQLQKEIEGIKRRIEQLE
ncbi:hypothetical protein [Flavobacterium lacustre]|uniref:hypothetical protein n=1 Tax=Flavobacterium lacustre TaxID=3016339 RepID=UPI0022B61ED7|nr:hypothetical protein [Flavobacterium lacustre]